MGTPSLEKQKHEESLKKHINEFPDYIKEYVQEQ